jgi:hypothetical protein
MFRDVVRRRKGLRSPRGHQRVPSRQRALDGQCIRVINGKRPGVRGKLLHLCYNFCPNHWTIRLVVSQSFIGSADDREASRVRFVS